MAKYKVGDIGTFSKTIAEYDIYSFAGIIGDFNPVHVNKVEAEKTQFKKRIAHGMLGASLISTVLGMIMPGPGTIYLEQNCKFRKPVYVGDTLTAIVKITEIDRERKSKLLTWVKNQNDVIVIEGNAVVILPD